MFANLSKLYKGLDIVTNKASLKEQNGIPHHLLSYLDPFEEADVLEFQSAAVEKVRKTSHSMSIYFRLKIYIVETRSQYL